MKIILVGCGWLGQQLLPVLTDAGHQIYATCRSVSSLNALPAGTEGYILDLNQPLQQQSSNLTALFRDAVIICAIAPGRQPADNNYVQSLQHLYQLMTEAGSKAAVHFSSTGIYQGLTGRVDESCVPQLQLPRVQLLAAGEQALQQFHCCITLRLAGLMGPGRHPGRAVAGKTLPEPDAAVNMIHAIDIAAALQHLLQRDRWCSAVYNLCCPIALTRKAFYQYATQLAATEVSFATDTTQFRYIDPQKFIRQFDFRYRFASAVDALTYCF